MPNTPKQSHTPGPWTALPSDDGMTYIHGPQSIAWVVARMEPNHPDTEANARLIAAAPEMLDLLKQAADPMFWFAPDPKKYDAFYARAGELLARVEA